MKIQVAKRDLAAALHLVDASLGTGASDDIANHYVFRVKQDDAGVWQSEVLTYTSRLCAGAPFVSTVEHEDGEPTAFTIEGSRLKPLIKAIKEAALTFTFNGSRTAYTGPGDGGGSLTFDSLDPAKYPYWDKALEDAKVIATVSASALSQAFTWSKAFVLGQDEEARRPDLCVFESRGGFIRATNTKTVVLVEIPGMEDAGYRVHRDDASKIVTYLSAVGTEDVEVLESDAAMYLRSAGGAVFGEYRFNVRFPDNLKVGRIDKDPYWWDIPVDKLKFGLTTLGCGSVKDDNRLWFRVSNGILTLGKAASSQGESEVFSDSIPLIAHGQEDDAPDMPPNGFSLDLPELTKLLAVHTGDTLRLGVHPRGKSGFIRVSYTFETVHCQIILAWLRD